MTHTEKDDLVKRLRREARVHFVHPISPLLTEAADELEEVRASLKPFAEAGKGIDPIDDDKWLMWEHPHSNKVNIGDFRRAARAFFGKGE